MLCWSGGVWLLYPERGEDLPYLFLPVPSNLQEIELGKLESLSIEVVVPLGGLQQKLSFPISSCVCVVQHCGFLHASIPSQTSLGPHIPERLSLTISEAGQILVPAAQSACLALL